MIPFHFSIFIKKSLKNLYFCYYLNNLIRIFTLKFKILYAAKLELDSTINSI
jgi:hypothetical protein